MKYFSQSLRITGYVRNIDPNASMFEIEAPSGDIFQAYISSETYFYMIRNTDKIDRDRSDRSIQNKLERYLEKDKLVSACGIMQIHENKMRYDVKSVALFGDRRDHFIFEEGHWWITQISSFADTWLKRQFGLGSNFDFTGYRTDLTATGGKIEERPTQECDTISRLIYGLSSAYLLTGNNRYLLAAKAGVEYQRDMFRTISHDGSFIIWHHAVSNGEKIYASLFSDDRDTIPLYEQIYALAGLAQFYRITQDWETLYDIQRTVNFFLKFFKDEKNGGFFSHLDPVSITPDSDRLGDNRSKKNWNSIGDHTPAYLLNILLAIDNIHELEKDYNEYIAIQKEVADIICTKFIDPQSPYVNERFNEDWTPDQTYKWQQDRAVIGHNLKIAWNLTRLYHLFNNSEYLELAEDIGDKMPDAGMDMIRGGWYDVVERHPKNNMPIDFTWHNRKAWWQQEQAILAYLILSGTVSDKEKKEKYLKLARQSIAFWNLAFLDHDYGETYFDVFDNGYPFIYEDRANKGSHSKSGYHSMELNYLAHLYYRLLVKKDRPVTLYFYPSENRT
ncbi:MAG: AGE family epimerase/isomerase, partial [Nitrospirota bacterium]